MLNPGDHTYSKNNTTVIRLIRPEKIYCALPLVQSNLGYLTACCGENPEEKENIEQKRVIQMQKDQEVAKQVIEKLKRCLCQQGQPKVVKQQSPTSNTSQLFLTLSALESAGSNSHTSPRSLLQLPLPLVDTARKPFPCCKQLYEVWQQSDINCKDFVVVVKILKMSRTKNPQTTWELKVV